MFISRKVKFKNAYFQISRAQPSWIIVTCYGCPIVLTQRALWFSRRFTTQLVYASRIIMSLIELTWIILSKRIHNSFWIKTLRRSLHKSARNSQQLTLTSLTISSKIGFGKHGLSSSDKPETGERNRSAKHTVTFSSPRLNSKFT